METSSPFVFDASTDEEVGFGNAWEAGYGGGGCQLGDMDDCDWLSELLVQVGEEKEDPRLEALKPPAAEIVDDGDDDDDCVVLDGDPDEPAAVAVAAKCDVDGGGDDDVVIVAEKGEIACRDFPHARHLCSKFLFASTPHQLHCTQCHCYVCDTLAPCIQWGSGISNINHCHATDKDEYWKIERELERMKRSEKPVPINTTSLPEPLFFPAQTQSLMQPVCLPLTAQSVAQGGPHPSRRAFHSIPVSRGCISKPTRSVGSFLPGNSHLRVPISSMNPPNRRLSQQINLGHQSYLPRPPQQIMFGHQSYFPRPPQVYSYSYHIQTPMPPPTYVNTTNLMNKSIFPTQTGSYPLSQAVSSYQPEAGNDSIRNELNSRTTMMPPIPCLGTRLENDNQPSQPQGRSNPSSSLPDNLPDDFQQVSHGQNGVICSSSNVFKPPRNSRPLGSGENDNHQKGAAIAGNHSSLTFDAGCELPESVLHNRVDFSFDGLMFENRYSSEDLEVPVPPLWSNG